MGESGDPAGSSALFDDPVALAAPVAHRLAAAHCGIDPASGHSCAWYHGSRLYIRALGTGQCDMPDTHRAFFERAFRGLAGARAGDLLVSGSADYVMPALILNAYGGAPMPRLTVVDVCATPLHLIGWYAERHAVTIAMRHANILDLSD